VTRSTRGVRLKRPDLIAEEIKRWILTSGLSPGDRLPREPELISFYSCSRGTIREALKSLEVQGIVEVIPGPSGGARVLEADINRAADLLRNLFYFESLSAADLYSLREVLEPLVVEEVVKKLSDADFERLDATIEICKKGHKGLISVENHRFAEIDFHVILANRVPNRLLRFFALFVLSLLRTLVTPKAVAQGADDVFSCHTIDAHVDILTALRSGDRAKARSVMRHHIVQAGKMVDKIEATFDRERLLGMASVTGEHLSMPVVPRKAIRKRSEFTTG
jgi:GntR family transcriptional repressor for pyruvate dehydrogenase complex